MQREEDSLCVAETSLKEAIVETEISVERPRRGADERVNLAPPPLGFPTLVIQPHPTLFIIIYNYPNYTKGQANPS